MDQYCGEGNPKGLITIWQYWSNQGGQRATLVSDSLEEPRAITLHPGKGSDTFFISITFITFIISRRFMSCLP